jgi:hypothetical protein
MLINKPLIIFMDTIKMVNIGWRRDPKLQATSNRLQASGFRLQGAGCRPVHQSTSVSELTGRDSRHDLRFTEYALVCRIPACFCDGSPDEFFPSLKIQASGFRLQASSHKVQVAGLFTKAPA